MMREGGGRQIRQVRLSIIIDGANVDLMMCGIDYEA